MQHRKIIFILIAAAISLLTYDMVSIGSFAQVNSTQSNSSEVATSTIKEGRSTQDYIENIRSLLNQTIYTYSANDTSKAEELATTASLDNFEYIEEPIGEELSEQGEELLREKLISQIDSDAPIEEIAQTINATNKVLDDAEKSVTP